jgi:spore maturation protein SpmB
MYNVINDYIGGLGFMVTQDTFKRGFNNGIKTLWDLLKMMVPIYIGVQILSVSGLLNIIADFFTPFMSFFGLPGEASLTLMIGYFSGIYGALGTLAAIKLNAVQATTIAIMISTAHNLISESAVVKKLGVSAMASALVRIFFSVLFGFLYFRIFG